MQEHITPIINRIKLDIEKIVGLPITIDCVENLTTFYTVTNIKTIYPVTNLQRNVCSFSLVPMPGCCGMIIASAVAVFAPYGGKGIGKLLLRAREEAALSAGYTLLLETCTEQANGREIGMLEKYGYKRVDRFVNNRTKNTVVVLTRNLREPAKALESKAL